MTETRSQKDRGAVRLDEAADWSVKLEHAELHRTEMTMEELEEAEAFVADPQNKQALDLAARVTSHVESWRHRQFDLSSGDSDPPLTQDISNEDIVPLAHAAPILHHRWHWPIAGVALALMMLVGAINLPRWRESAETVHPQQSFVTGAAQTRHVILADGSAVTLGAQTQLTVSFGPHRRLVSLERGEALFDVAHDPTRPFTVRAGRGTITALGTRFDVRRAEDRVTVTVTEGSVAVAHERRSIADLTPKVEPPDVYWQPARLQRGQALTYDQVHDRGEIETASPSSAAQWMAGRFGYREVPLKYVLADVNRYRQNPIVLEDEAAGEYAFTGTVFLDHTAEWLLFLQKYLPLEVTQMTDGRIVIASRTASGSGEDGSRRGASAVGSLPN